MMNSINRRKRKRKGCRWDEIRKRKI